MCLFCDHDMIDEEDWWEVCTLYVETAGNWHYITTQIAMKYEGHAMRPKRWHPQDIREIFLGHILEVVYTNPNHLERFDDALVHFILGQARDYTGGINDCEAGTGRSFFNPYEYWELASPDNGRAAKDFHARDNSKSTGHHFQCWQSSAV